MDKELLKSIRSALNDLSLMFLFYQVRNGGPSEIDYSMLTRRFFGEIEKIDAAIGLEGETQDLMGGNNNSGDGG